MAIFLPERTATAATSLTPREIVAELDKHVIGQAKAKRAVAIALRNRIRRQRLAPEIAEEVTPKNILMIGPTGVGKTEIARRLAKLAQSPFIKVEASKFTEVGYVGRDVESMVRDLVELAVDMVRAERSDDVKDKAREAAEERLLDLLLPPMRPSPGATEQFDSPNVVRIPTASSTEQTAREQANRTRERMREQLRTGTAGRSHRRARRSECGDAVIRDHCRHVGRGDRRQPQGHDGQHVRRAVEDTADEGARRAAAPDRRGVREARGHGVGGAHGRAAGRAGGHHLHRRDRQDRQPRRHGRRRSRRPDVSREGVQRDILPIVEGTTVNTKHGMVKTDHILFIAAGAFHVSKPSDLIPELQGRFPIRVELEPLTRDDFVRILTEPRSALVKQYVALLGADGIELSFTPKAVERIADFAARVNDATENIGARRLHTVMERLLDHISFEGPDLKPKVVTIDEAYVDRMLADIAKNEDLSRYIL